MNGHDLTGEMEEEFRNNNTIRHIKAKPPKEAYLYFPSENDKIEFDEKNPMKTLRRIFEAGTEYNTFEKKKIDELSSEIIKHNIKNRSKQLIFPSDWQKYTTLRFLQATAYNIHKTIDMIIANIEWRKINIPKQLTPKAIEILNKGFIYIHGRDNRYRPIMHIVASVYDKNSKIYTFEDWTTAVIYFMEYVINNLLIPGQVENWNIICDVKDISIVFLPKDLKRILAMLQENYRCRLFVMFIINIGSFANVLWKVVKSMIDPSTERKIKLLKNENTNDVFAFINKSQIEKKYGGNAENLTSYYFPPIFPSDDYYIETDSPSTLLINETTYKKKVKENKCIVPSPYIDYNDTNEENISKIEIEGQSKNLLLFYRFFLC